MSSPNDQRKFKNEVIIQSIAFIGLATISPRVMVHLPKILLF